MIIKSFNKLQTTMLRLMSVLKDKLRVTQLKLLKLNLIFKIQIREFVNFFYKSIKFNQLILNFELIN